MESVAAEFGSISIRRIVWCFRKKDQLMNLSRLGKLCLIIAVLLGSVGCSSYKYVGERKNGKAHGQGTVTYPKTGSQYVGEWKNGKWHGQGTYTYANGNKHVGGYRNGSRNGQGTMTYTSGDKYVGDFKDSNTTGQGTMTYGNGNKYVGGWVKGEYQGMGTFTFASGRVREGLWWGGKFEPSSKTVQTQSSPTVLIPTPTPRSSDSGVSFDGDKAFKLGMELMRGSGYNYIK